MGAIEITQNSCLRVLLEPQSMALILDKLPEDVLKKHREQKSDNGIIESLIEKAALVVPSGIAHGPLMPMLRSMTLPMLKYYFVQSERSFKKIMQLMTTEDDQQMEEFFKLMMSSYKMEMKPPREFNKNDLKNFTAPIVLFASDDDIFFPAKRVFPRAKEIFATMPELIKITGNHLPSSDTMAFVCERIGEAFKS